MVRQWQKLFWRNRYSHVAISGPDYVKLAEAYGIPGFRATATDEVADVLQKAFSIDGPAIIEFNVVKEDNVYPMIPGGQTYNEIMDVPDEDTPGHEDEKTEEQELITVSKG